MNGETEKLKVFNYRWMGWPAGMTAYLSHPAHFNLIISQSVERFPVCPMLVTYFVGYALAFPTKINQNGDQKKFDDFTHENPTFLKNHPYKKLLSKYTVQSSKRRFFFFDSKR